MDRKERRRGLGLNVANQERKLTGVPSRWSNEKQRLELWAGGSDMGSQRVWSRRLRWLSTCQGKCTKTVHENKGCLRGVVTLFRSLDLREWKFDGMWDPTGISLAL